MNLELLNKGYYITETKTVEELLELGKSLGKLIPSRVKGPLLDVIIPKRKDEAKPNSLSGIYGTKTIPFHTDGAYIKVPPRFIVLRYTQGTETPTPTLLKKPDLEKLSSFERHYFFHKIWFVTNGIDKFYSPIVDAGSHFIRFDEGCMSRDKIEDKDIFATIIKKYETITVDWEINKTMILDNWKMIHSRPSVRNEEINFRKIQRINIY